MATPADLPLKRYLALQIKTDREVLDLLRSIKRDVDASLRNLEGSTKAGAVVRREQLRLAQHAIDDAVNAAWIRLADVIEKGALVGARDAVLVNGEFDRALVSAGLSGAQRAALLDSNIAQSQQAVRHALNRQLDTTGATRIPLSEKVYHSRNLVRGEVDRMVESALARGLSAKEFAAAVRQFVNPNTPGGVRYAAMRLSRTEINNAFHFAQTRDNAMKPWVDGQKWYLSGSHPKPDECNDFAEQNRFDLGVGVFPKDDVPNKPHPHCLCYITPATVSEEEWLRKFKAGQYNDYIDSRMPVGLPDKAVAATRKVKAGSGAAKPFNYRTDVRESGLTKRHRDAVDQYWSGGDFGSEYLNGGLRRNTLKSFNKQRAVVEALDDAIKRSTLSAPVDVFRGVAGDVTHNMKVGDLVSDKGFGSVSTDRSAIEPFRKGFLPGQKEGKVIRIRLPSGHSAAKVPSGLDELLLARNGKYRVVKVTPTEVIMEPI